MGGWRWIAAWRSTMKAGVRMIQLTINGKPYRLGPGDVGVIGSNEMHNAKNVGTTRAEYFICNIGRDDI